MKTLLIRYRTHAEHAAENLALIQGVFDQLRREAPPGLDYQVLRSTDGCVFMHLVRIGGADDHNPLPTMQAFRQFQARLGDRCSEPPQATELTPVEHYQARA